MDTPLEILVLGRAGSAVGALWAYISGHEGDARQRLVFAIGFVWAMLGTAVVTQFALMQLGLGSFPLVGVGLLVVFLFLPWRAVPDAGAGLIRAAGKGAMLGCLGGIAVGLLPW